MSNIGFLSQVGNGSKTSFSICVSLFILVESRGQYVKRHLLRMVSGAQSSLKKYSSPKSCRPSSALLGNTVIPVYLRTLTLSGSNKPKVTELWWEGGLKTRPVDPDPGARSFAYIQSFNPHCSLLRSESGDRFYEVYMSCPRSQRQTGLGSADSKPIVFSLQVTLPLCACTS